MVKVSIRLRDSVRVGIRVRIRVNVRVSVMASVRVSARVSVRKYFFLEYLGLVYLVSMKIYLKFKQ